MKKGIIIALVSAIVLGGAIAAGSGIFTTKSKIESQFATPVTDAYREQIQHSEEYKGVAIVQDTTNLTSYGTGCIVGKNKLITNAHVSSLDLDKLTVKVADGSGGYKEFKVKNVKNAPEHIDVSIVEVYPNEDGSTINDNVKNLELASLEEINNEKVGDIVDAIGYPGDKDYGTLWKSTGEITYTDENFIAYSAFISPGNSGSPIFNKEGKIIALVNASTGETESTKNTSFGVLLSEDIYKFIQENI